ncbi:hypothetical protein BgiMline_003563 [Biomphalaria glabrata]|nr:splicing factor 3A subunit 2-like [Biomphalaria glabrata]KAI8793540.1 splicing factor 3A subunit 2 [Biomphalaria glabrata]
MVDPVVSSRFGKRPLLDIPAMQVSGHRGIEVPSLQSPIYSAISANPFPNTHNPMYGPGVYNQQPGYMTTGGLIPPRPAPAIYIDRRHNSAPQMGFYNPPPPRQYFYGPNGEVVQPAPFYNPQGMYPGVANPYPVPAPMPVPVRMPYPSYGPFNPGFNITCDLEFGRVTNINVRDSMGEFRGIPDFLREELMRTYGKFPFTEVKVKLENGEFHIYATHERRKKQQRRRRRDRDSDVDSDSYYDDDDDDQYIRFDPTYKSDIDSYTSGVRPRRPGDRPRGIVHEKGWNRYR